MLRIDLDHRARIIACYIQAEVDDVGDRLQIDARVVNPTDRVVWEIGHDYRLRLSVRPLRTVGLPLLIAIG